MFLSFSYKNQRNRGMRLLLNYKGINKILNKVENYAGIVQFVHENFFLKMSKWTLTYIDSDGDPIALDSDLDVQTMLETSTRDHLKVYIKDAEVGQEIDITEAQSSKISEEKPKEEEINVAEEPKGIMTEQQEEVKLEQVSSEEKKEAELPEAQEANHCRWKAMWKKKMEEKMAKFVDERVESLIPCLVKKIEDKMNKIEPKVENKESKVTHDVKCTGCGVPQIVGIRYKCTKCPSFDLCEACEHTIPHDHNMIKMRFLEEPEKMEEECQWGGRGWWRKHHGGRHCRFNFGEQEDHRSDVKDSKFKLTKKCFKMSKFFGGKPEDYKTFVEKNLEMRFNELSQLYIAENGEGVIVNEATNEKLEEKLEKLSFYFNEPKENFASIIKRMPGSNLKELIATIHLRKEQVPEEKAEEKKIEEKKVGEVEKVEQQPSKILSVKDEPVKILDEKEAQEKKVEQKLPVPPPAPEQPKEDPKSGWGWWGGAYKKPVDAKKKNECIILMKEYFGPEKVYDYIKFFDQNSDLTQEEIISKYIETISQ